MNEKPISEALFVRSEELASLRQMIGQIQGLARMVGSVAQVALVVDANVVLGDLLWLCSKRTNPTAKTELMEAVSAGTIIACIPPFALREIPEKIPYVAARRNVDEASLYSAWEEYRELLRIERPDPDRVQVLREGRDPDDADYIALADTIGARGILSRDKDIVAMGGTVVSMEVVGYLKDYSRAAAIEFNIKVSGFAFLNVSAASLVAAVEVLKGFTAQLRRLPDGVKICLVGLALLVLLNDKSRAKLDQAAQGIWNALSGLVPGLLAVTNEVFAEHQASKDRAMSCLEKAFDLIASTEDGVGLSEVAVSDGAGKSEQ